MDQMEAAALNRMKMQIENPQAQIEYFLREIREGRLVEVTRCRDCKYHDKDKACLCSGTPTFGYYMPDEWYCAEGKKKDNG